MDEGELLRLDHDTYQVKKLKHKCQRLVSVQVVSVCINVKH